MAGMGSSGGLFREKTKHGQFFHIPRTPGGYTRHDILVRGPGLPLPQTFLLPHHPKSAFLVSHSLSWTFSLTSAQSLLGVTAA
jgi:hypothetical protein